MAATPANGVSLASSVRIPDDVVFHDLQGEVVVLNLKTGVYFGLDPVGSRIWQLMREHGSLGNVRQALVDEYEVAEAPCTRDLLEFTARLWEAGLVEVAA